MGDQGRLVMLGGLSPGAGKSKLVHHLASMAADAVSVITEDEVWGRREFGLDPVDLATVRADFRQVIFDRRRTSAAEDLPALFVALAAQCAAAETLWLQDWTWPDLVALVLTEATQSERIALSTRLRTLAEPLRPLILYLDVPSGVAIERALAERGPIWFNRHFNRSPSSDVSAEDVHAAASDYEHRRTVHLKFLGASGWRVRHLDGQAGPLDVAHSALAVIAAA